MGLEGFSNNASGGMSPGDHLYAKTFNKLATFADKAQVGPSDGVLFTSNNGGIGMYIPQGVQDNGNGIIQQFQIFVEPYEIEGNTTDFSIIRVVKGEVVWSPKLIPVPLLPSCTTQTTIETWFALPEFPIIDDDNSTFIGDGGIRVPKVADVSIGIFIFKATNLPIDIDPIIVAVPNYVPSCPVEFPGDFPTPGAFWEVVKVGSVVYSEGDPNANPPIAPGWTITQNFIGSMTLPGDGGTSTTQSVLPAQLVTGGDTTFASPFQCFITEVNGERYLQIAIGAVSYSLSNMPTIFDGAFTHTKQAYFNKVQICPSEMRTNYSEMYPNPDFDPDPSFSNTMMEGGGGYKLYDSNDPIVLYAFKWDADNTLGNGGQFLTGELPTLAIFAQSNPTDINKITKDCGPSIYEQTMNVESMTGYKAEDTELAGDWGHCHTTWLNPRKVGYNYKAIATVVPKSNTFACFVSVEQVGVPLVCNAIQLISLVGEPSGGAIIFSYGGIPSVIPFPVTTLYTPFAIVESNELALFECLNSIPELTGNVQVSRRGNSYFVTFVNALQGTPIDLLTANVSGVTHFQYKFEVVQYHTGNLDITTPMQMGMTQLMNMADQTEEDDPYNLNEQGDWKDIVNKADCLACKDFSGDVTTEGVYSLSGFVDNNPSFFIAGGCTAEGVCEHPFQVHSTMGQISVCAGMVNNQIPTNIDEVFDNILDGYIFLAIDYDDATKAFPEADGVTIGADVVLPDSDGNVSYIAIAQIVGGQVNQLVGGSLWGDRIQVGAGESETAYYYYARV